MHSDNNIQAFLVYFSIVFLAVLLTLPPFISDYVVGHDLLYHLNWTELFHRQFFEGDLYPRWLNDMNGGQGSPIFYFYSPLPYYFSALFSLILPTANSTWHSMGATCCFALTVSSIGMFWFFKPISGKRNALIFTLLYMFFPYHVVVDLYIRFAYTEFFAIAWVPYIFIFTRQLAEGREHALWSLAIFYALLILSHIPTTLLLSPFILLFYYLCHDKSSKKIDIIVSLALGMSLTAFYLLPILVLKKHVSIDRMMTDRFYYENAFLLVAEKLYPNWSEFSSFLNNLAIVTLITTISALLSQQKLTRGAAFYGLASLFCIFMMYPASRIIWQIIPILALVQFPWRFFIVISFTLFFLSAATVDVKRTGLSKYAFYISIIILGSLSVFSGYFVYLKSTSGISDEHRATIVKSLITREGVTEYLPADTPEIYFQKINTRALNRIDEMFSGQRIPLNQEVLVHGGEIQATIETTVKQRIIMSQFYFPTWQAIYADGKGTLQLQRSSDGFLEFTLDKGVHRLVFLHQRALAMKIGNLISLLALGYTLLRLVNRLRAGHGQFIL